MKARWARIAAAGLCLGTAQAQTNVLFMLADDMGVDAVACYAEHPDPGRTPVLDGLAASGILFRNVWSAPTCSPTRAGILTGQHPSRTGVGIAILPGIDRYQLWEGERTLPHLLEPDITTLLVGKWHLGLSQEDKLPGLGEPLLHPLRCGFRHWTGNYVVLPGQTFGQGYYDWFQVVDGVETKSTVYNTTALVDAALGYIAQTPEPWFLELTFNAPHTPFHKPPPGLHTFNLPPTVQEDVPLHAKAAVEAMDTEIGRLLASMDPVVRSHTVVLFAGDNGSSPLATTLPFLAAHAKGTLYEGGINVPLIVSGPDVAAGAECAGLVSLTDVFATVTQLFDKPQTTGLDSVSLVPYFLEPALPSLRDTVYTETFSPVGFPPYSQLHRAVRNERYKLVRHTIGGVTHEEFFDLLADPFELDNLLPTPLPQSAQAAFDALSAAIVLKPEAWNAVGLGAAGSAGEPRLAGHSDLSPGAPISLVLEDGCATAPAILLIGPQWEGKVFHGALRGPLPLFTSPFLVTDPTGELHLEGTWPDDVPAGQLLVLQAWLVDEAAPTGYAASNCLILTAPGP